jgi:hypothetical protein
MYVFYAYVSHHIFMTSYSVCGAGGIPSYALQPTEAYCANPALGSPVHLQSAPRQTAWENSIIERRDYGREMTDQI